MVYIKRYGLLLVVCVLGCSEPLPHPLESLQYAVFTNEQWGSEFQADYLEIRNAYHEFDEGKYNDATTFFLDRNAFTFEDGSGSYIKPSFKHCETVYFEFKKLIKYYDAEIQKMKQTEEVITKPRVSSKVFLQEGVVWNQIKTCKNA